jgi:hypothetical protein
VPEQDDGKTILHSAADPSVPFSAVRDVRTRVVGIRCGEGRGRDLRCRSFDGGRGGRGFCRLLRLCGNGLLRFGFGWGSGLGGIVLRGCSSGILCLDGMRFGGD